MLVAAFLLWIDELRLFLRKNARIGICFAKATFVLEKSVLRNYLVYFVLILLQIAFLFVTYLFFYLEDSVFLLKLAIEFFTVIILV